MWLLSQEEVALIQETLSLWRLAPEHLVGSTGVLPVPVIPGPATIPTPLPDAQSSVQVVT